MLQRISIPLISSSIVLFPASLSGSSSVLCRSSTFSLLSYSANAFSSAAAPGGSGSGSDKNKNTKQSAGQKQHSKSRKPNQSSSSRPSSPPRPAAPAAASAAASASASTSVPSSSQSSPSQAAPTAVPTAAAAKPAAAPAAAPAAPAAASAAAAGSGAGASGPVAVVSRKPLSPVPRAGTSAAQVSSRQTKPPLSGLKAPQVADIPPHIKNARRKLVWYVARATAYANQPGVYTSGLTEEEQKKREKKVKAAQAYVEKDIQDFDNLVDKAIANPKKPEECKSNNELFIQMLAAIVKNKIPIPNIAGNITSFAPKNPPTAGEDARKIYGLASKFGGDYTVERIYKELGSFQHSLNTFPNVRYYLVNPKTGFEDRLKSLKSIILDRNLHPLTQNVILKLFVENKFVTDPFGKLATELKNLYAYNTKYVEVEITTAQKVKPHILSIIIQTIQKATNKTEKYHFTTKQDKSIIGGFSIKIGDYMLDYSMKADYRKYQKWLEAAVAEGAKEGGKEAGASA